MACRWVTIWRARHNHKIYGESKTLFARLVTKITSVQLGKKHHNLRMLFEKT
jgi:hypothetical protein